MSKTRNLAAIIVIGSALGLSACNSLPRFGNNNAKEAAAEDKAGRITMVLADEAIKPNPELAAVEIVLPEPETIEAWTQSGATAAKVVGHVTAAPQLTVAWRTSVGKGSDRKSAVTTPPVTSETTIYTLDADQTVYATDLNTGRTQWKKGLKGTTRRDKSALGGGLAVAGDTLIVASGFGFVSALDASSGAENRPVCSKAQALRLWKTS